jgi:hypothetical protein
VKFKFVKYLYITVYWNTWLLHLSCHLVWTIWSGHKAVIQFHVLNVILPPVETFLNFKWLNDCKNCFLNTYCVLRCVVIIFVIFEDRAFWDIALCSLRVMDVSEVHTASIIRVMNHSDDGRSTHLWHVGLLQDYMALYPRRL